MPHNTMTKIKSGSNLPMIAAVLSLISIVFNIAGNRYFLQNIMGCILVIVVPSIITVLFAIITIMYANKRLSLMVLPVLLLTFYLFLRESGLLYIFFWGFDDYFDYLMDQFFIPLLIAFLYLGLMLSSVMILLGTFKTRISAFIFGIINMIIIMIYPVLSSFVFGSYFVRATYTDAIGVGLLVTAILLIILGIEDKSVMSMQKVQMNQEPDIPYQAVQQEAPLGQNMNQASHNSQAVNFSNIPGYQNNVNQAGPIGTGNSFSNTQFKNTYDDMQARLTENDIIVDKLRQLSILHSQGVINDTDFEQKKRELLNKI